MSPGKLLPMDVAAPSSTRDIEGPTPLAPQPSLPESVQSVPSPGRQLPMMVLCTLAAFVAAALVFLVQPMVGKMILPRLRPHPNGWRSHDPKSTFPPSTGTAPGLRPALIVMSRPGPISRAAF